MNFKFIEMHGSFYDFQIISSAIVCQLVCFVIVSKVITPFPCTSCGGESDLFCWFIFMIMPLDKDSNRIFFYCVCQQNPFNSFINNNESTNLQIPLLYMHLHAPSFWRKSWQKRLPNCDNTHEKFALVSMYCLFYAPYLYVPPGWEKRETLWAASGSGTCMLESYFHQI